MQINSDYRDLLLRFNETAEPFYTKDIDLRVDPTPEKAVKVFAALQAFGAPTADLTVQDLCNAGVFFQIGIAPNRIDIMTDVTGLRFAEAWTRAERFDFDGLAAPVLSRDDIILAKQTANRPEDRMAVRRLKPVHRKPRARTRNRPNA